MLIARPSSLLAIVALGACVHSYPADTPPTELVAVRPTTLPVRARNVLLLVVDSLGRDAVSETLMPDVHELASAGTSLEGWSTATYAKPAIAGILTGIAPAHLAMATDNARLPRNVWTLQSWLGCEGFVTASFVANGFISSSFGFAEGWNHHTNYIRQSLPHRAEEVLADAATWIHNQDERFFAYVHLIDPHHPYDPPADFAPDDAGLELRPRQVVGRLQELHRTGQSPSQKEGAWIRGLYDGEVRYVDRSIAHFLEGLRQAGRLRDTLVVITSDHREVPGDPAFVGSHRASDALAPVPLVYLGPGAPPAETGPIETQAIASHILVGAGVATETASRAFGVAPAGAETGDDECPDGITYELCLQLEALAYATIDCRRCPPEGEPALSCE